MLKDQKANQSLPPTCGSDCHLVPEIAEARGKPHVPQKMLLQQEHCRGTIKRFCCFYKDYSSILVIQKAAKCVMDGREGKKKKGGETFKGTGIDGRVNSQMHR